MDTTTTPTTQPNWKGEGTPQHWFDIYDPDKNKPTMNQNLLDTACRDDILVPVREPTSAAEYCISWTMVMSDKAIDTVLCCSCGNRSTRITPANFNDSTLYFKFSEQIKQRSQNPLTDVLYIVNLASDYIDTLGAYLSEKEAEDSIQEMKNKNHLNEQGQKMWVVPFHEVDGQTRGGAQCLMENIGIISAAEWLISTPMYG